MQNKIPSAAFIIIGNEILDGSTKEGNLVQLIAHLNQKGISLIEARVVRDDEQAIISAVRHCSKNYDYVFTSGGIGPTHDDITAQAIAKCFEVDLLLNDEALQRMESRYENPAYVNDAIRKMAYIPAGAELIDNEVSAAPGFRLHNTYILAGVPSIFTAMLDFIFKDIVASKILHNKSVYVHAGESRIAAQLTQLEESSSGIEIGSYPRQDDKGNYVVKVVFRGYDENAVDECRTALKKLLKEEGVKTSSVLN